MRKTKNIIFNTINVLIATFFLSLIFVSCSPDRELEIKTTYIDSLKKLELSNDVLLNLDVEKLQTRITQIDRWYIRAADTSFDVAQKLISELTGVKTIYKQYINAYFPYEAAQDAIKDELKTYYSNYKTIDKDEFKTKYANFSKELKDLNQQLIPISQPVYEVEFTFNRLEKVFQK